MSHAISQLVELTTPDINDLLPIVHGGATKKIKYQNLVPQALAQLPTHFFFAQNGARINRLNDRVLIGGATASDGAFPNVQQDWLEKLGSVSFNGGDGVDQNGGSAQLVSLTDESNISSVIGAFFGAQTKLQTSAAPSTYGFGAVAVNNNLTIDTPIWIGYFEGHRVTSAAGETTGFEIEMRNSGGPSTPACPTPYTSSILGYVSNLQLGAGAGLDPTGQSDITTALEIFSNGKKFAQGICFVAGSLSTAGPGGSMEAIALAEDMQMHWFKSNGTLAGGFWIDGAGAMRINAPGGLWVNGTQVTVP